ncbi:MAG: hypothetical protein IPP40_02620 [bacterium]|nr:hypothetical protein [bacterium]
MPRRSSRPIVQLVGNLAKIAIPLVLIAAAAWWFLNRDVTPYGQLRITSTIKGADIYIDGVQTGALTDSILLDVEIGRRLITVRGPGLVSDPEVAIVEIQQDRMSIATFVMSDSARLATPDIVPVRDGVRQDIFSTDEEMIRSIPAAPQRKSMLDFSDFGDDELTNTNRNNGSRTETTKPAPRLSQSSGSAPNQISEVTRTSLTGTQITVTSEPTGALIIVNGARTMNRTPYTFRGLDRGYYVFSLELAEHLATPDSIEIALSESGQSELASFSLQPVNKLPVPQLSVQTRPLAAGIRIDGTAVGVGSAKVSSNYGARIIEFANVPGYKTPEPVRVNVTTESPDHEIIGTYERLSGSALVAVVPNENFIKFDGKKLRVYIDNELILDGPKDSFDATLLGSLYPGERAIKVQYEDLITEEIVQLTDGSVAELTIRVDAMFGKRKLKFKAKTDIPLDKWQARYKKSNVLTQS